MCPSIWLGEQWLWGYSACGTSILDDASCGRFAIWERFDNRFLFIDFRPSCQPEEVAANSAAQPKIWQKLARIESGLEWRHFAWLMERFS
jgi:hypothetical protein